MRQAQIFSGSSHPTLVQSICDCLGQSPGEVELGKFSNGETKVNINTSIREKDVFIVQSGSEKINDDVMELLVMISACQSGSAKTITAVMPYFPYSRQSKKKTHRGCIAARLLANLLRVAGVDHVITVDLHASQMKGFFHCPVENLIAEPFFSNWIKLNIPNWQQSMVVSKNPGGTKRATSLADALKINFGIVMTDRRRPAHHRQSISSSMTLANGGAPTGQKMSYIPGKVIVDIEDNDHINRATVPTNAATSTNRSSGQSIVNGGIQNGGTSTHRPQTNNGSSLSTISEMATSLPGASSTTTRAANGTTAANHDSALKDDEDATNADSEVITGRLVDGHIVDDHEPSTNGLDSDDESTTHDNMTASIISGHSTARGIGRARSESNALGGSGDALASSDDEEEQLKNPDMESTATLVGNVKEKTVFIMDDMIDKSASWIAAAETVVKRGGATKVYCMATHGLFGDNSLDEMEQCECITGIVVTNSLSISPEKAARSSKLIVIDMSNLLAEAIRRTAHGESISRLLFSR